MRQGFTLFFSTVLGGLQGHPTTPITQHRVILMADIYYMKGYKAKTAKEKASGEKSRGHQTQASKNLPAVGSQKQAEVFFYNSKM